MSDNTPLYPSAQSPARPKVVVLISGTGSNMLTLADAMSTQDGNTPSIDATLAAVISNRADAKGLEHAQTRGIDTACIEHSEYDSRDDFDLALMRAIDDYQPDLVVLAGFMRILTPSFVQRYHGRLINIHPSLLPKYQGLHTHQRALDAGDTEHGVSVHFVTEELDGGPIIAQAIVPVLDNDDATTLKQRVQTQEHVLYPVVVKWFVEGRLALKGEGVTLDGQPLPTSGLTLES